MFGFNSGNIISILMNEKSSEELKNLNETFSSVFKKHEVGNCTFLEKVEKNDNLPELAWHNSQYGFYFFTSDLIIDKKLYSQLCDLLVKN